MAEYLNSWSDDWATTSASEQSTEHVPTIETIWKAMREFEEKAKSKDLGPDVLVLTHSEMQELKLHCEKRDPPLACCGLPSDPWSIYGIRIEECATKAEVKLRVLELASYGVKAGYIKESE